MTRVAKATIVLVLLAALILGALAWSELRDSEDPLNVLAIPFLILYTVLALIGVIILDSLFRVARGAGRAWREIDDSPITPDSLFTGGDSEKERRHS